MFKSHFFPIVLALGMAACAAPPADPGLKEASRVTIDSFPSVHVDARRVDVWLPAGYAKNAAGHYAVLYMHDGQNLFDTTLAFGHEEWKIDEVASRMLEADSLRPFIVVGIWNTPKRFREYAPAKPFDDTPASYQERLGAERGKGALADAYLLFLTRELKPFIDSVYGCSRRREDTYMMGSSMGGLVSLYAVLEYPDVFAGAGCVSTHWPLSLLQNDTVFSRAMGRYLWSKLPEAGNPKLYFDYGTVALDSLYPPHQMYIDSLLRAISYPADLWTSRKFAGESHSEASWSKRVHEPLYFLLQKKPANQQ